MWRIEIAVVGGENEILRASTCSLGLHGRRKRARPSFAGNLDRVLQPSGRAFGNIERVLMSQLPLLLARPMMGALYALLAAG
jgi:hypothetical protein